MLFLGTTFAAAILWTGIGAAQLERLHTAQGSAARWIWLAGIFLVAFVLPLAVPRPKRIGRLRFFQFVSVGVAISLLGAAIAQRPLTLLETARAGLEVAARLGTNPSTPVAVREVPKPAPAPAPAPEPPAEPPHPRMPVAPTGTIKEVLANVLTGEYLERERIPIVPSGYVEGLTPASARVFVNTRLERVATLLGFVEMLVLQDAFRKTDVPTLRARLAALKAEAATLGDREAMRAVLDFQNTLTLASAHLERPEERYSAEQVRAQAVEDADSAICEPSGEAMRCALDDEGVTLVRAEGGWQVDRVDQSAKRKPKTSKHDPTPQETDCEALRVEEKCLSDAMAELEACAPKSGEAGKGHIDFREVKHEGGSCRFSDGTTLQWISDSRASRQIFKFSIFKDGKLCGSLTDFQLKARPKPGHSSKGWNVLHQTDVVGPSGRVVLQSPASGDVFDEDGVCMGGCLRRLTCQSGKTLDRADGCIDRWRTLGRSATGVFSVTRYGATEPFVRCTQADNQRMPIGPSTPVDTSDDPARPSPRTKAPTVVGPPPKLETQNQQK